MTYSPFYTKSYQKCVKKHGKSRMNRIEDLEKRVLTDPLADPPISHRLDIKKGVDLRGKRRRMDGDGKYVVVYMVCRECIDLKFRELGYNNCKGCQDIPAEGVIFLAYGPHDDMYAKDWQATIQQNKK